MSIQLKSMLTLQLLIILVAWGCRRDKCKDVSCVQGTCVEGNCICVNGYEGVLCDSRQSEKFIANYQLEEDCTAGGDTYQVQVMEDSSLITGLKIIGLWESLDTLQAYLIHGGSQFEIPKQALGQNEISGLGTYSASAPNLTIEYYLFSAGASTYFDHCLAQLTRL